MGGKISNVQKAPKWTKDRREVCLQRGPGMPAGGNHDTKIERFDVTGDRIDDYVQVDKLEYYECPDYYKYTALRTLFKLGNSKDGDAYITNMSGEKFRPGDMVLVGDTRYFFFDLPLPQMVDLKSGDPDRNMIIVLLIAEEALSEIKNKGLAGEAAVDILMKTSIASRVGNIKHGGDAISLLGDNYKIYQKILEDLRNPGNAQLLTGLILTALQNLAKSENAAAERKKETQAIQE